MIFPESVTVSGRKYIPQAAAPTGATHRVLTDAEVGRTDRPNLPMVWVFNDDRVTLTRNWQYFIRAINSGMLPRHCAAPFIFTRAFANGTGFGDPSDPRKNYFTNEDMDGELPLLDKVRTCGNATVKYSGGKVTMLDGDNPPPLKIGYSQPASLAEAKLERYLYTPQTHPHLFFAAVTNRGDGNASPFPNGALYSWYGSTPVTFIPHVCPGGFAAYPPVRWTANTPTLRTL